MGLGGGGYSLLDNSVLTHINVYYIFGRFENLQGAVFSEGYEILMVQLLRIPSDV